MTEKEVKSVISLEFASNVLTRQRLKILNNLQNQVLSSDEIMESFDCSMEDIKALYEAALIDSVHDGYTFNQEALVITAGDAVDYGRPDEV